MFYKVSCFQPVGNFYVPGVDLGRRFGCLVGALGGILLIWEAPKNKPEFDRILGHPPGEPKSRQYGQGRVKYGSRGAVDTDYSLQDTNLATA